MSRMIRVMVASSIWLAEGAASERCEAGTADVPFVQEYHEPHVLGNAGGMNDVRAVATDGTGRVWAATRAGVYTLNPGETRWSGRMTKDDAGPAFAVVTDAAGTVWVGAWNGVYRSTATGLEKIAGIEQPIAVLCATDRGMVAAGPDGLWRIDRGRPVRMAVRCARSIRAIVPDPAGGLWIATERGLYHHTSSGTTWYRSEEELLSAAVTSLAYAQDRRLWIGGLGGITIYKGTRRTAHFTPTEGLPSIEVRSVDRGPDGTMWVGTTGGVARYDGKTWSLRHSRRWLVNDDVRDVAFDADGTAWIATRGGVSAIKRRRMTLAEKAEYYQRVCMARHVREPGLVEKCRLKVPGDTRTWEPRDDDNDGQYTAMYLAMESFRYAATQNPQARANARKAFHAFRVLQSVTETPGFFARTVVPATWKRMADPNRKTSDRQWAERRVRNPRDKRVDTLWRMSRDGKWRWKGDTSSDEVTGHFFGYLTYYDLAADEAERTRVRDHVRRIMDAIIADGYVFKDIDGTHTKWGVWSPEKLNDDPDWEIERGTNSVEILSFLKVTYHMTGDEKYQRHYLELLHEHDYARNVLRPKAMNPAWRTHIDEELLALAFPGLLLYEKDPELKRLYRKSLDQWYAACRGDRSPYFNFVYGSLVGEDPERDASIAFLRDTPLDLVYWRVDNSKREDIRLVRVPEFESIQTDRLLPPSERVTFRWDRNPWLAVQGNGGHTESDGVYWLLPYWMGRHYGFIQPPR